MSGGASKHCRYLEHESYTDVQRTTAFIKSEQGYEQLTSQLASAILYK